MDPPDVEHDLLQEAVAPEERRTGRAELQQLPIGRPVVVAFTMLASDFSDRRSRNEGRAWARAAPGPWPVGYGSPTPQEARAGGSAAPDFSGGFGL
jgi:hypothetical protein